MKKNLMDVRIKNADKGEIEAIFSRFDVIDLDGDITVKGAFTEGAPVVISAYGHMSHVGELPIGKGTIHNLDDVAVMKGQFFLNTTHGRDAWETVKALSTDGLQEWSYSLDDVVSRKDVVDGRTVQVIESVRVKEVSPVLQGAGIDTGTVSTKGAKQLASATRQALTVAARERWGAESVWVYVDDYDPDEGFAIVDVESDDECRLLQVDYSIDGDTVTFADDETEVVRTVAYARKGKFSECSDIALRGVKQLVEMAVERLTLRAAEGKSITEQTDVYDLVVAALEPLTKAIDATQTPATETSEAEADVLANEFARFIALSQGGVTA